MIQSGEEKYKPALKAMWKCCFPDDTDIFIDFYFDKVYQNDETLLYLENGKPVAAFQMIPYSLKNNAETSQAAYISGAMTHPDFRRKGLMKQLLLASFDLMKEKGFDYTFLIPQETWLFDFYAKVGYKAISPEVSLQEKKENLGQNINKNINVYTSFIEEKQQIKPESFFPVYTRFLSEIPQVVLKTETQFENILKEFFAGNGVLFVNEQGIAFTFDRDNQIIIKEFFYSNKETKALFLKNIRKHYGIEKTLIHNRSDTQLAGRKGMLKRLNDNKPEIASVYINMMLD